MYVWKSLSQPRLKMVSNLQQMDLKSGKQQDATL